ncbi:PTS sugar transporter subunit IIB, partial [Salmonella enterica subsp. enterica serovar Kentucky]|nr:PTS sugar transporter subunit IIB [Salmonella enterica subsp. enterica serovar Kentucky]
MIVFLRVDHRLLHGQVAFSWTQYVFEGCGVIADDRSSPADRSTDPTRVA